MPAVDKNSTILLSGASGFLAVHVAQQLLQRGFTVRGTVRSEEKGNYLDNLFKEQGLDSKWSWVIVEDVEAEGAFDEAVKGVDGVAHTASPFHFNVSDPHKDLINPAVKGTTGILKSALSEPKIKRIVITSSFASILNPVDPPHTFTEKDWNTFSPKQVEEKGKEVDGGQAYRASKTLAEKAAWDFIGKEKPSFDISTINPPLIFGPLLHQFKGEKGLNTSTQAWYAFLKGSKSDDDAVAPASNFVDVRDVAQLHIEALVTPEAGNERFAASAGPLFYQDFIDYLNEPEQEKLKGDFKDLTKGKPGAKLEKEKIIALDASKAKKTFGWEPIAWQKTVTDMTQSLADRQKEW